MAQFVPIAWTAIRGTVGRRWLHWLQTLAVVTIVGALILPALRRNPEGVHNYFASASPWQRGLAIFASVAMFTFIMFKLLSPRLAHLNAFRRYPPMWSAWAGAAGLLCILDLVVGLGSTDFVATWWEWLVYAGGAIGITVACKYLLHSPDIHSKPPSLPAPTSPDDLLRDWATLERWLRCEQPSDDDLIGNRRIARRLKGYLVSRGGTVGLIGPFGSGKSSVLKWLMEEVRYARKPDQPEIWFCEQSCWGFEDSASAVHQILARAMETVGQHADCFSIRSLPESYRKTFSAGGDWFRTLADLALGSVDPLEQFRHMSDVLATANARLVFIIEDLDRNTSSRFDRQEVLALLQRLRVSDRLSFVLSTGQTSTRDIDFAKLCDHIEILGEFDSDRIASLIGSVRTRCLETFPHIPTVPRNENPWSPLRSMLLSRFDHVSLLEAASRLLRTPRALKHALRRTYQAWEVLFGEVDFDHLLGVNILRHGAPEAFNFLLRHWNQLHDDPRSWQAQGDQLPRLRERLTADWRQVTQNVEWDVRAAHALLLHLLPTAGEYLGEVSGTGRGCQQGICHHRYWFRVVNEEVDPSQERDQTVLRDLTGWMTSRSSESPLVEGLSRGGDYVGVWEHHVGTVFGWDRGAGLVLADQVLAQFRTPDGARTPVEEPHPIWGDAIFPNIVFRALLQYANRTVERNTSSRDWLEGQIRLAMPVSLSLVNDLYYYWASPRIGIIRPEDRGHIRQLIYQLALGQLQTSDELIRVSPPELPYGVYRLVFPPDDDCPSECVGVTFWRWLGPILAEALRREPRIFAVQVAHLIAESRRGEYPGVEIHMVDRARLDGFFGKQSEEIIRLLADERDRLQGRNRDFLDQVVRSGESLTRAVTQTESS